MKPEKMEEPEMQPIRRIRVPKEDLENWEKELQEDGNFSDKEIDMLLGTMSPDHAAHLMLENYKEQYTKAHGEEPSRQNIEAAKNYMELRYGVRPE